jgi:secondary thiamine-phosphate synthase enzyme
MQVQVQMKQFNISTKSRDEFVDVTRLVQSYVDETDSQSGTCIVYVPHTTAGVTVNENADPDVPHDIIEQLDQIVPWRARYYKHMEGNSAAHIKSSIIGTSVNVLIENGELVLGTWQSIFFCEFDGPRSRRFFVKILKDGV